MSILKIFILSVSKLKFSVSKLKFFAQVLLSENFSDGMVLTIHKLQNAKDDNFLQLLGKSL